MKSIKYLLLLPALIVLFSMVSCSDDDSGPFSNNIEEFFFENCEADDINFIPQTNRITITLPVDSPVESLIPSIRVSSGAIITPMSGVAQDFSKPVRYTVTAPNGDVKYYEVNVNVKKSTEKDIKSFGFKVDGLLYQGIIDDKTHKIVVPVSKLIDLTTITTEIELSKNATVEPKSGEIQNFNQDVEYVVTAADGSTVKYTVEVQVPQDVPAKIFTFKFNGLDPVVESRIDEYAKTIYLTVPRSTNLTELVPTFTISKGSTITPATGVKQDFTNAVSYTLKKGEVEDIYKVAVVYDDFDLKITSVTPTTMNAGDEFIINGEFDPINNNVRMGIKNISKTYVLDIVETKRNQLKVKTLPTMEESDIYNVIVDVNGGNALGYGSDITVLRPNLPQITSKNKDLYYVDEDIILTGKNFNLPNLKVTISVGNTSFDVTEKTVNSAGTELKFKAPAGFPKNVTCTINLCNGDECSSTTYQSMGVN